jgi:prophage regulatory protein
MRISRKLRGPQVWGSDGKTGLGMSTIYALMSAGVFPRPVRVAPGAVAWIEREVDLVLEARAAGATDDQLRKLVKQLEANRPSLEQVLVAAMELAQAGANTPPTTGRSTTPERPRGRGRPKKTIALATAG